MLPRQQLLAGESTRIVWGKVKAARDDWINAGYSAEKLPAIRVREHALPALLEASGVQTTRDLVGWYFLVEEQFGETRNGTPYVSLRDAARVTFVPDPRTTEAD